MSSFPSSPVESSLPRLSWRTIYRLAASGFAVLAVVRWFVAVDSNPWLDSVALMVTATWYAVAGDGWLLRRDASRSDTPVALAFFVPLIGWLGWAAGSWKIDVSAELVGVACLAAAAIRSNLGWLFVTAAALVAVLAGSSAGGISPSLLSWIRWCVLLPLAIMAVRVLMLPARRNAAVSPEVSDPAGSSGKDSVPSSESPDGSAAWDRQAAGVLHDLNNQLAGLAGMTAALGAQLPTASQSNLPPELTERIDALRYQVDQAVQVARTLGTAAPTEGATVDLAELVRAAQPLLRGLLPTDVQLELDWDEGPLAVRGDAVSLQRILVNLVRNAGEACAGSGRGRVDVKVERVGGEGEPWDAGTPGQAFGRLRVEDNGPGIDDEAARLVFDAGFTTRGSGRGIGLGVVRELASAAGGIVRCEGRPGQGARFDVQFPLVAHRENAALAPIVPDSDREPTQQRTREPGREIWLIIEDEPSIRDSVQLVLTAAGFQIEAFESGDAALDWLAESTEPVSGAVVDYALPGLNGMELLRAFRDRGWDFPVILCTGDRSRIREQEPAPEAYLDKPYDLEELERMLASFGA